MLCNMVWCVSLCVLSCERHAVQWAMWSVTCHRILDDAVWCHVRYRFTIPTFHGMCATDFSPTQQETFEKTVCSHLALLASGLHDLAQSAIPSGPCVAATFKTLSHFYNTVLCLAKYVRPIPLSLCFLLPVYRVICLL